MEIVVQLDPLIGVVPPQAVVIIVSMPIRTLPVLEHWSWGGSSRGYIAEPYGRSAGNTTANEKCQWLSGPHTRSCSILPDLRASTGFCDDIADRLIT
jgi:hypothetical protein